MDGGTNPTGRINPEHAQYYFVTKRHVEEMTSPEAKKAAEKEKLLVGRTIKQEDLKSVGDSRFGRILFHLKNIIYNMKKVFASKKSEFHKIKAEQRDQFNTAIAKITQFVRNHHAKAILEVNTQEKKELKEAVTNLRDLQSVAKSPYLKKQLERLETVMGELEEHLKMDVHKRQDDRAKLADLPKIFETPEKQKIGKKETKEQATQTTRETHDMGTGMEERTFSIVDTQTVAKHLQDMESQATISETFAGAVGGGKEGEGGGGMGGTGGTGGGGPGKANVQRVGGAGGSGTAEGKGQEVGDKGEVGGVAAPQEIVEEAVKEEEAVELLTPEQYLLPPVGKDLDTTHPLYKLKLGERIEKYRENMAGIKSAFEKYQSAESNYQEIQARKLELFPKLQKAPQVQRAGGPPPPPPGPPPAPPKAPPPGLKKGAGHAAVKKGDHQALNFVKKELLPKIVDKQMAEDNLFHMLFEKEGTAIDMNRLGEFVKRYIDLSNEMIGKLQEEMDTLVAASKVKAKAKTAHEKESEAGEKIRHQIDSYESYMERAESLRKQLLRAENEIEGLRAKLNKELEAQLTGEKKFSDDIVRAVGEALKNIEVKENNEITVRTKKMEEYLHEADKAILDLHEMLNPKEKVKAGPSRKLTADERHAAKEAQEARKKLIIASSADIIEQAKKKLSE